MGSGVFEEPCGEPAEIPLGAGVGASAEDDEEAFLLRGEEKSAEVGVAAELVSAGGGFVYVPEDVGGHGVEAHGPGHLETGVPVFAGDAGIVKLAGDDFEGLAIEDEPVGLHGKGVALLRRWYRLRPGEFRCDTAGGGEAGGTGQKKGWKEAGAMQANAEAEGRRRSHERAVKGRSHVSSFGRMFQDGNGPLLCAGCDLCSLKSTRMMVRTSTGVPFWI